MRATRVASVVSAVFWIALACILPSAAGTPATSPSRSKEDPEWQVIDHLLDEQKFKEASNKIDALLRRAQSGGDEQTWLRALERSVESRIRQGGVETALEQLRSTPWPPSSRARAELNLALAHASVGYLERYSYEIDTRVRIESAATVPLKQWTREQILAAADHALASVWAQRESLDSEPVANLSGVLVPNNYPPEVRGTIRDAVTYLYASFIANSQRWSPQESEDAKRLDLTPLLGSSQSLAAVANRPHLHPVERAASMLAELEAWHDHQGQRAAALEAFLERCMLLHAASERSTSWESIQTALKSRLDTERGIPWWSEGQAVAATLRMHETDAAAQRDAHALATAGEKAYPGTPGAKNCAHIAGTIELPEFSLHAMQSDGTGKRSISVDHRNLSQLFFRAYRVNLPARFATYDPFPRRGETEKLLTGQTPVAAWSEALPATPDFRTHRTYVTPPLTAPGAYTVVVSANLSFTGKMNPILQVDMILGNLVIAQESSGTHLRLRVLNGATGAPVAGATVEFHSLRDKSTDAKTRTIVTDADGVVSTSAEDQLVALARHGADIAMTGASLSSDDTSLRHISFFTDRSIYRPGQTLFWKLVAYDSRNHRLQPTLAPKSNVNVQLIDPNRQVVASADVTTNGFATASGSFVIPADRPLGGWMLSAENRDGTSIRVEEYKRPTFEVALKEPAEAPRLNRVTVLRGEARYYFGAPVTAGTVRWHVHREPVYPRWWWGERTNVSSQEVAAGTAELSDGTFEARFTPNAVEGLQPEVTYSYRLTADVTDEGGETRSAERVFRVGTSAIEATIESDLAFAEPGRAGRMTVRRTDLDGEPRSGGGTWRLVSLMPPAAAQLPADEPQEKPKDSLLTTPGDVLRPRWQSQRTNLAILSGYPDGAERAHGELSHDSGGRATVDLPPLTAGIYRLRYATRDSFGAMAEAQHDFIVAGDAPLPIASVLEPQRSTATAGETMRVLLHSGFLGQELELQIAHGAEMEYRRLVSTAAPLVLDLPITDRDRGGMTLRLVAVRDHQVLVENASIAVPWDNREVKIEYQTFRDLIRPGAKETWRVKVSQKGPGGAEPAAAELLAYMYDRSLDTYVNRQPPNLLSNWPHAYPTYFHTTLGGRWASWVRSGQLAPVPEGAMLRRDQLGLESRVTDNLRALGYVGGAENVTVAAESPLLDERSMSASRQAPKVAQGMAAFDSFGGPLPTSPPSPPPGGMTAEPGGPGLRTNFSETAFWQPHLLTGADGTASIEFTVPDSVTSWNVWVHALTRDFRSGADERQTRSAKDLLARPYLPRFLREGDRAELRVEINDTSDHALDGTLTLDVLDAEQETSLLKEFAIDPSRATQRFHVEAGKSTSVTIPLTAPQRVGQANFKVVASAGDASDGELRPLPLLPSRIHLTESKFMALHDQEKKSVTFTDLQRADDPSRINSSLVVTLDAQLFYSVLAAVPYLVRYPYECTEQTLDRFLSTAVLTSMFGHYPAISRVAEQLAQRSTKELPFDGPDANREMALEETPWLLESQGDSRRGMARDEPLIRVLDPRIARTQRDSALAKLKKSQREDGSFPWWPGGPASDYMTLYLLYGLSRASEFGVEVPRDMVVRGWRYLAHRYQDEFHDQLEKPNCHCSWEFLTFLTYLSTTYPDPGWMGDALPLSERQRILAASFRHWKEQSPMLKSMLALALHRMGRPKDAELVMDAIMDGAKTTPEEGTFWQPEDHAWIWYHDTIETHALVLRTLGEIRPSDPRLPGLVQWLFLNKKLNHWKSTRATAEVVYSLAKYLAAHQELAVREAAQVQIGPESTNFMFEPDRYTGAKNQVVVAGERLGPERSTVTVSKETPGLMFASATWHYSTEKLPTAGKGDLFSVERRYFRRERKGKELVLSPLTEGAVLAPGDEVDVELVLRSRAPAEYVHLRDPRAAGFEPGVALSGFKWTGILNYYEEVRDSGTNFFFESLPVGEYTFHYQVHASLAGTFRIGPATVESVYAPEFSAFSAGHVVKIEGQH